MDSRLRVILGVLLVAAGIFYDKIKKSEAPKLKAPDSSIVSLVNKLPEITSETDSNKLSGTFFSISEGVPKTNLESNLQVQYYLDYVGKNTIGNELLLENGQKKYPDFSPAAASAIEETIGPQNESDPLTDEEKQKLEKLFYGFAWKLYSSLHDDVFEKYKDKAKAVIAEYNLDEDIPDTVVDTECICNGKGYVIHGDGHKTDCPCIESGEECKHNPACKSSGEEPPPIQEEIKSPTIMQEKKKKGLLKWRKN